MDEDLPRLDRDSLIAEVRRLRDGIRAHRDATGHDLCWHHPGLWALLPETVEPAIAVPDWPQFLRGCVAYRASLDRQAPERPGPKTSTRSEGGFGAVGPRGTGRGQKTP